MPFSSKEKKREYNKKYHKKWYADPKNREKAKARALVSKKRYVKRNYAYLTEYKSNHPCIKCRESDPICLSFHHINGEDKEKCVSDLAKSACSLKKIKKEIDKCVVLCHNCHARETQKKKKMMKKKDDIKERTKTGTDVRN